MANPSIELACPGKPGQALSSPMLDVSPDSAQLTMTKLLALLLLISAVALAGWINNAGEPIVDSDSRKAIGDFGAQLICVFHAMPVHFLNHFQS
jgi:hypothetical protein